MVEQILAGIVLGILVSYTAYRIGALKLSGMWAAALLGAIVFGLGGWGWAIILLGFFISSSLLSRLAKRLASSLNQKFSKGSQRDAVQVAANGGMAGGLVLVYFLIGRAEPQSTWLTAIWLAYCGALAAANADTWGTELGVLNQAPPVLITTGQPVERGTSGAVSFLGTLSAFGGSALIALLAVVVDATKLTPTGILPWWTYLLVAVGGLSGALVDSFLGATVQAIYTCPDCGKETEQHPYHICGARTRQVRGLSWMNNDLVNLICVLVGASIPIMCIWLF